MRFARRLAHRLARVEPVAGIAVLGLSGFVQACGGAADGDARALDAAALDSMGRRGDSLVAFALSRPTFDSISFRLRADSATRDTTERAIPATGSTSLDARREAPPRGGDGATRRAAIDSLDRVTQASAMLDANPMSRRAQARGDSMARAAVQRLVGGPSGDRARADTARGVVTLVGNGPTKTAMLKTGTGTLVTLSGMGSRGLTRLEGAEVVARGVRVSPRDIVMTDYVVRRMNGQAVIDGKLMGSDNVWSVELTDGSGSRRIDVLPSALDGMAGVRIWMAIREGSGTPVAYGLIPQR